MILQIIQQTIAAAVGTVAFSVLYSVPRRFFAPCGLVGGTGWLFYAGLSALGMGETSSVFTATLMVVFMSRILSVRKRCPSTVFVSTGIFPLVPGVGIYWTIYYIITNQLSAALQSGVSAIKAAVAIVLGITVMFEVPNRFFNHSAPRR